MPQGGYMSALFPLLADEKRPNFNLSMKSVSPDEYLARRGSFADQYDVMVTEFANKHGLTMTRDYVWQFAVPTPSYNSIALVGTAADAFIPTVEGIELPMRLKDAMFIAELLSDRGATLVPLFPLS